MGESRNHCHRAFSGSHKERSVYNIPPWHSQYNLLSVNRTSLLDNKMPHVSNWWENDCPAEHNRLTANTAARLLSPSPSKEGSPLGRRAMCQTYNAFEGSGRRRGREEEKMRLSYGDGPTLSLLHNVQVVFTAHVPENCSSPAVNTGAPECTINACMSLCMWWECLNLHPFAFSRLIMYEKVIPPVLIIRGFRCVPSRTCNSGPTRHLGLIYKAKYNTWEGPTKWNQTFSVTINKWVPALVISLCVFAQFFFPPFRQGIGGIAIRKGINELFVFLICQRPV